MRFLGFSTLVVATLVACSVQAEPFKDKAVGFTKKLAADPLVIEAVQKQNDEMGEVSEADILMQDKHWREQVKDDVILKPLVEEIMEKEISKYLHDMVAKNSLWVTEVIVMDDQGLNVAVYPETSDYWQGDEAKWKETFLKGSDALHLGKIEEDASTGKYQIQISHSVKDPESNQAIGAVTVGFTMDIGSF